MPKGNAVLNCVSFWSESILLATKVGFNDSGETRKKKFVVDFGDRAHKRNVAPALWFFVVSSWFWEHCKSGAAEARWHQQSFMRCSSDGSNSGILRMSVRTLSGPGALPRGVLLRGQVMAKSWPSHGQNTWRLLTMHYLTQALFDPGQKYLSHKYDPGHKYDPESNNVSIPKK